MVEQKVIVQLLNKDKQENLGRLIISAKYQSSNQEYENFSTPLMEFKNVPKVEEPDDNTPIQYNLKTPVEPGARIMLLEETPYQVRFEGFVEHDQNPIFPTLMKEQENNSLIFEEWRIREQEKSPILEGTLNFHSYVGKSFFNVKIGDIESTSHPFEVRSRKIGYQDQYPAMIGDLSEAASGLILESKAPLYQLYDFADKVRRSYYEDFMFIEYLFKPENLQESYEYIRRNIYNRLEQKIEEIPSCLASTITSSDLIRMVSCSENLQRLKEPIKGWPPEMKNYFPIRINQEICEETIDTPENRLLKSFLLSLESLILQIRKRVPEGYIKERVEEYNAILQDYLADDWLQDVGTLHFVPSNSQVLQKREGYRSIFQFYLNFEFAFRFEWKEMGDLLQGYNRRLSEIYEYWCYFKLVKVLGALSNQNVGFENIFEKRGGRRWSLSLKRGSSSRQQFQIKLDGKLIDFYLWYNKRFSRKTRNPSYSLPFKPDYSMLVKIDDHQFFLHFDAKYRSEGDVLEFYEEIGKEPLSRDVVTEETLEAFDQKEDDVVQERDMNEEVLRKYKDGDIYKMHTYKDAILRSEGAYIFYPGDKKAIFRVKDGQEIPSVGAFPLTPGKNGFEDQELQDFIIAVLRKFI